MAERLSQTAGNNGFESMGKSFTSEGTSNRPFTQSAKKKSKQIGKGTDLKSKEEEYRLASRINRQ